MKIADLTPAQFAAVAAPFVAAGEGHQRAMERALIVVEGAEAFLHGIERQCKAADAEPYTPHSGSGDP